MARELVHPLPLILASASTSRRELLSQTGLDFSIMESHINEKSIEASFIRERAVSIARAKAEAVSQKLKKPAIILAADTMIVFNSEVMEKPKYKMTALEMLKKLNGNIHTVITGWTVYNTYKQTWQLGMSETYVKFRELTHQDLVSYVDDNPVTQWAGGYNSRLSNAVTFIERIEGSLTGLNGLPLEQVIPALKEEWARPYRQKKRIL